MAVLGQSPDMHLIYDRAPPTVAKAGCLGKKITAGGACRASPLHHLHLRLTEQTNTSDLETRTFFFCELVLPPFELVSF